MNTVLKALDSRTNTFAFSVCIAFVIVIIVAGAYIENIRLIEPLLILPIIILSWYGGKTAGVTLASIVIFLTLFADTMTSEYYLFSSEALFYTTLRVITYVLTATLVINFRSVHNKETTLANTDDLTGLLNIRSFSVELANEILRSVRYDHTFSLSYIDIDNFKAINDTLGHLEGDRLLKTVSNSLTVSLRQTDIIARLGGDEFAVIFPETDAKEVKDAFAKTSTLLKDKMKHKGWNVTFSIGIVTFEKLPLDIKEAIHVADELMYTVKNNKKNNVAFQVMRENNI